MMFERFSPAARTAVVLSQDVARRRNARHLTAAHLLRAVVADDGPVGSLLRVAGLAPATVDAALDDGAGALDRIDGQALAAIGIDLDQVRARLLASFGAPAVTADRPRRRRLGLRRRPPQRSYRTGGHIPFTPEAKGCLERAVREAASLREDHIGVEHLALALLACPGDGVPAVLGRAGVAAEPLRAAILDGHRKAG